ncbi:hypothetical protein [Yersinia enterocolitica]|uniref:hypothetical protein n=1 Tax=Yersinia enterocolitica TaxID=630 RepID=UPI001C61102F|nr:hypothetical protein [Yersinia enterocolitica]MBW5823387.1 hypothetical protein [Yersinia enterocolitica]MBW5853159.1 hypothetical protein [Yersinia enterocolitica]MBW5870570.1 hypothetical protein [Yersinia enterocolitica]MBW5879466.1 hypothetical protein [Yersinia enterocolitica]
MGMNSVVKNSSFIIAYIACLGWGSAYFYGWGLSNYYGFSWWYIAIGTDNIARSLFYAFSILFFWFLGWAIGVVLFFFVTKKTKIRKLSFFRLFFALFLFFIPVAIEISLLNKTVVWQLFGGSLFLAFVMAFFIRLYSLYFSVECLSLLNLARKNLLIICMVFFMVYFWIFSFFVGFYKPYIKKEYEMIRYNDGWYYVLFRTNDSLILSRSYSKGNNRFIFYAFNSTKSYEITVVRVKL